MRTSDRLCIRDLTIESDCCSIRPLVGFFESPSDFSSVIVPSCFGIAPWSCWILALRLLALSLGYLSLRTSDRLCIEEHTSVSEAFVSVNRFLRVTFDFSFVTDPPRFGIAPWSCWIVPRDRLRVHEVICSCELPIDVYRNALPMVRLFIA